MSRFKAQLAELKRQVEHEKLKKELQKITDQAVNTSNALDEPMQNPDINRELKTRRGLKDLMESFLERIRGM